MALLRTDPPLASNYGAAARHTRVQVVERVKRKAETFGQDVSSSGDSSGGSDGAANGGLSYKVRPEVVAQLYEQWVMPLTKEVEVQYLLRRLDGEPGGAGGGK